MATFNGAENSYWIKGEFFDVWADENDLHITDGAPEFVWVDVETTGLDAHNQVTLELGIVLTDSVGNVCRDGAIDWRIWNEDPKLCHGKTWQHAVDNLDPFVREMHTKSGLLKELFATAVRPGLLDTMSPPIVAWDAVQWLTERCGDERKLQLSGSTPHFDRAFLRADLPALEDWFHYRSGVDVSGIREVAKRVNAAVIESQPRKQEKHRPIPDLIDSVRLYRHLLQNFLVMDTETRKVF